MKQVTDGPLQFATRGAPLPMHVHLSDVLLPGMRALSVLHNEVAKIFGSRSWDPEEPGCLADFTRLIQVLDGALSRIDPLRETMPAIELRALHREAIRALVANVRGHVLMAMTLSAVDMDEAVRWQGAGNRAFDVSAKHAERVDAFIELIEQSPSDGPFRVDGSLDIAALVWAGVRGASSASPSIARGAEIARNAYGDISGIRTLPDERAIALLPTLSFGAQAVDHYALVERANLLRSVLDGGTSSTWIVEPDLLVERLSRGVERVVDQAERLDRELRHELPRRHRMRSMAEVYKDLVEGALVDLGGIVLVSARTSRGDDNATYEIDVIEGIKSGEVVEELSRLGAPWAGTVEMVIRNASSHAGIEVTADGITAKSRRIENGRVVSRKELHLSDAEFHEDMVALQETLLALQLAVLPWVWSHGAEHVATAVSMELVTPGQRNQTIALLGGLVGLSDVEVAEDDDSVKVSANLREGIGEPDEVGILSLMPAAFGAVPTAKRATLNIAGRDSVSFERDEFSGGDDALPHSRPRLGISTAKWLLHNGGPWTQVNEAMYVTFPLTAVFFDSVRYASQEPKRTENIHAAIASLRIMRSRLDDVFPEERRRKFTGEVVAGTDRLIVALTGLADSRASDDVAAGRYAREVVTMLEPMLAVQQRVIAIRDAG
ncbi:hypothetical protein [Kitasatospora sp. NBC_01266]|uniref:hypothetical protein n=1 Tax=Kitasatospora sp. NBC_01266 TaxID=2903572 RepID=UPI002E347497|nr:hypothetical protein [Kitasatospora sp. NBC_01266]